MPVPSNSPSSMPSQLDELAPVKVFRMHWTDRVGDAVFRSLARLGVGPASLLTTTGRRTGQRRSTPVIPVRQGDHMWLVAPYGAVAWLLNARASGHVTLRHGRSNHEYQIREVTAHEAGPVLKQYVDVATATRPYFRAAVGAPASDFEAEAGLHPVLELIEQVTARTESGDATWNQLAPDTTRRTLAALNSAQAGAGADCSSHRRAGVGRNGIDPVGHRRLEAQRIISALG